MPERVEGADLGQRGQFLAVDARARDEILERVKPCSGFGIRDSGLGTGGWELDARR
jgi:hypothetical protein